MPKSIVDIENSLLDLKVKSQVPKYAISELSHLMNDDMYVTYAMKFNSGIWILSSIAILFVFSSFILPVVQNYSTRPYVLLLLIFLPRLWTKCVVFTNMAIFIFPSYHIGNSTVIPIQDICSISIVRNSLQIEDGKSKYKLIRFFGFSKKQKEKMVNAIKILLDKNEYGVSNE